MSAYLQRLASTAMRTERRVQPLVGGLFTRQPEQAFEEIATTIVLRTADSRTNHLPKATDRAGSPRLSSDESRMEETERSALVEPTAPPISEGLHHRTLGPPIEHNSDFTSQRKEAIERAESPAQSREKLAAPDLLGMLSQFIERPANSDVPGKVQPLVGEVESADFDEPMRATALRPANAGQVRTFARPPAAHSKTPSHVRAGGDDIQIHIGRIEVIAVPQQPAPRPASTPARRGPSLEEYLQRRDRRLR